MVTTEEIQAAASQAAATQRPEENKCIWLVVPGTDYKDEIKVSDGLVGENWGRLNARETVVRIPLSVVNAWLEKSRSNGLVKVG